MNIRICFLNLILASYFLGCTSSEESYYGYEPEYNGKYVNSEAKLMAWYQIPDKYLHTNDSVHRSSFYSGYYLAEKIIENNINDTPGFNIKPHPEKVTELKQLRYRMIVERNSKYITGMVVSFTNSTNDTILLSGQDGSIIMIQEAINPIGEWQPIEYWQNSSCGNSNVQIYFPPNSSIEVGSFRYTGSFKTKIRFKFRFFNEKPINGKYEKKIIYSESFDGKVNYSQFQKIKPYYLNSYLE